MKNLKYISYLKVIGIILVVFGHSFHEWNGVFEDTVLYRIFMVMRMPLFTFTSGYTLAYCFMARPPVRLHIYDFPAFMVRKCCLTASATPFPAYALVGTHNALIGGRNLCACAGTSFPKSP